MRTDMYGFCYFPDTSGIGEIVEGIMVDLVDLIRTLQVILLHKSEAAERAFFCSSCDGCQQGDQDRDALSAAGLQHCFHLQGKLFTGCPVDPDAPAGLL